MGKPILVLGKTGSGKSTSLRNLDPKETFLLNVVGKDLPFRGSKKKFNKENGNMLKAHSYSTILQVLKQVSEQKPEVKTIVIDDFQYVMSFEFMLTTTGGFDKFNEIAEHAFAIIRAANNLRDDLTVVFLAHTDENIDSMGQKSHKIKTIGRLLDEKIVIEGLFTIVLMAEQKQVGMEIQYGFRTKGTPLDTVKTPMGMFEDEFIDNDLKLVLDKITEYQEG